MLCKRRIEVRRKVIFSVKINFISFMIKASSLLEVQIFYYLSAGQGIIRLRYVLSGVKMVYLVYKIPYMKSWVTLMVILLDAKNVVVPL